MCIVNTPKVGAQNVPAPTDVSAEGLTTGASAISNSNAGLLGRLALTGGSRSARSSNANAVAGAPEGETSSSTPGGTLGLPSNYLGTPVYGGLKPKL